MAILVCFSGNLFLWRKIKSIFRKTLTVVSFAFKAGQYEGQWSVTGLVHVMDSGQFLRIGQHEGQVSVTGLVSMKDIGQ